MSFRKKIVSTTRRWIGTPYHHQASRRGAGCDCLGLIRGVWRELYGTDAEMPPAYSPDWAETSGRETMIEAAGRHMIWRAPAQVRWGDVLIFRLRKGALAKHAAILVSDDTMVHAIEGAPVCEVHLGRWWRRHIAAAFSFPEID